MKYGQLTKADHPDLIFRSNGHITKQSASMLRNDGKKYCHKCDKILSVACFHVGFGICISCRRERDRLKQRTINGRFSFSRSNARIVGKQWLLTLDEYGEIVQQPCRYCSMANNRSGVGLDRLDNKIGYMSSNVVSCCVECNVARGNNFSVDEMVKYIGPAIRIAKLARLNT